MMLLWYKNAKRRKNSKQFLPHDAYASAVLAVEILFVCLSVILFSLQNKRN